jgi:hypothetical protein
VTASQPSPWQLALGDRFDDLDPRLRTYFGPIPAGRVGRGHGTFAVVGTPRRWLWPAFAVLAPAHVLFPVWQTDVAFTVVNTPGRALTAARTFSFARGDRTMRDAVACSHGSLQDVLGDPQRICVRLRADVVDGGLLLTSTRAWLILGGIRFPIPSFLAPRMTLTETVGRDGRQHVAFVLTAPLIGRIYEYRGAFDYGIEAA